MGHVAHAHNFETASNPKRQPSTARGKHTVRADSVQVEPGSEPTEFENQRIAK